MSELISTALFEDPDPDGTDKYGMLPLIMEMPDEESDDSGAEKRGKGGDGGDEDDALIEPSSIDVSVPAGTELPDEDDGAYSTLTARGADDLSPGEAEDLINYMRPMSEEEHAFLNESPLNRDIERVDDPAHTDDVLRAGKGDHGVDKYLRDSSYGDLLDSRAPSDTWGEGHRHRRRHHHRHLLQLLAQPGYGMQPGQHGITAPTTTTALAPYYPTQYYPGTSTPATLPYQQPTYVPGSSDTYSDANYILGRDRAKVQMVRGLGRKLVLEHANWLADQDMASGHPIRPRSYYENVGKLWAADRLKRALIPLSTTMGNWTPSHRDFVVTADGLLGETAPFRKRFSDALGSDYDMGGWSPWGAIKSAAKSVEHGVEKGASLAYRGAKFGFTKPLTYTYKGVKYVGKMAEKLALAPIRAIINRFTNTMVSRRANALAKQKGLSAPTAVEKASAKNWAKSLVRAKGGKYGGAIASLMGSEYGLVPVNISRSGNDLMGVGTAGVAGLILLGPVGLVALLTGLVKLSSSAAPAPDPGSADAASEADQASQDAGSQDATSEDPGAAADDGSSDSSDDGSYDSSGYVQPRRRPSITLEQLNRLPKSKRQRAKQLVQSGHIRLA